MNKHLKFLLLTGAVIFSFSGIAVAQNIPNIPVKTFLQLQDTPDTYSGQTGKVLQVTPTGLVFTATSTLGITSSAVWGSITGTLSNQTDLQTALNAKLSTTSASTTYVPYTGATADLDLGAYEVKTSSVHANSSAGVTIHNTSGQDVALFGAGGGLGVTFYDGVILNAQTANTLVSFGASKDLTSLATSTYPNLTEVSYIKGLTSSAQTQLDNKLNFAYASSTYIPYTGASFDGLPFFSSGSSTTVLNNGVGVLKYLSQVGTSTPTWQTVAAPGSLTYYLYQSSSSVAAYKKLDSEIPGATMQSISGTYTAASTTVTAWLSTSTAPGITSIPSGNWLIHIDATKTAGIKVATLYFDVFKYATTGVETLLFSTQQTPAITGTDTTNPQEFDVDSTQPAITLQTGDRIGIRLYILTSGAGTNPVVQVYFENQTQARLQLPGNTLDITNFVPYTGATANVNLGNFGLTSNSLTLRGVLVDSTSASGTLGQLLQSTGTSTRWVATSTLGFSTSQWTTSGSNIYYTTGNVGIGTTTPGNSLVVGGNIQTVNNILTKPTTNQTSTGDITTEFLSGSSTIMDLVFFNSDAKWYPANANSSTTASSTRLLGINLVTGQNGSSTQVVIRGFVRNDSWAFATGTPLYVGTTTSGTITANSPTASGNVNRVIGYALTPTIIYFDPSKEWISF